MIVKIYIISDAVPLDTSHAIVQREAVARGRPVVLSSAMSVVKKATWLVIVQTDMNKNNFHAVIEVEAAK